MKVTRINDLLTLYLDNVMIGSKTITTDDLYFGWKTHSANGRNFTYKDLVIQEL